MTDKPLVSGIRFSPTIELGHILQAIVMLAMFSGWGLYGFNQIQQQLNLQAAQMELFKQRLSSYETNANELRDSFKTSVTETRASLSRISDQIADLRTLVAGQGRGDVPRR